MITAILETCRYYLSRFGSLDVVGVVTKEEEEEVDEEVVGGTKPVKPKLSPASFFLFFFLWFSLRWTSRFLTWKLILGSAHMSMS